MRRAILFLSLVSLLLVPGCGDDGSDEPSRIAGNTLTIYASLPAHGPTAAAGDAAEIGMRRALASAGGRAGGREVRFVRLASTRPGEQAWDPGTVEANAERAVEDPTTIAYLGELDQGGSAVSLPVTNREGILQVSPADGLTSLTRTPAGKPSAGPARYYPDGEHTFVRLVPPDLEVARQIVRSLRADGDRRLALLHGDGVADRELEGMVAAFADASGIRVVVDGAVRDDDPEQMADTVEEVAAARPDAIVFTGAAGPTASRLLAALAVRMPGVPVYGGPGLASKSPSTQVPERTQAFTGVLREAARPQRARRLMAAFWREHGRRSVHPEALLGYEAMRLTLDAIDAGGPNRKAVVRAALSPRERDGVLGGYEVLRWGDVDGLRVVPLDLHRAAP